MNKKKLKLNIAGKLASYFLESKLSILIILTITVAGIMAVLITPRMYNPEIKVPAADIIIVRANTPAKEMENQIVKPLESLVAAIYGVNHTFSYAINNMAVTTVLFKVGENQEMSLMRLYNQIERNMDKMPLGTQQPLIKSIGVDDIPIMTITLSSKQLDIDQLREVACKLLEKIRGIPNIGTNEIIGGSPTTITVWLNSEKLAYYNIGLNQVSEMLKASNVFSTEGALVDHNKRTDVLVTHILTDTKSVGNIIIGTYKNKPVFLKDVSTVKKGPKEADYYSTFSYGKGSKNKSINNQIPAVTITIAKKSGSNAVFVSKDIIKRLHLLKHEMIPQDVHLTITRNYGNKANRAVSTLIEHLSIAVIVVILILLLFLGWREALIVTVTVPLVLLLVLTVGLIIGQTINRITLFALILSLGLLVDSAIVVIENIFRHLCCSGVGSFRERIVNATNEVGNPTNIATIGVIFAFIPMAFVTGMMGPFMRPIPINVPIAMVASLFLAYSIVPYGVNLLLKKRFQNGELSQKNKKHGKSFLERAYKNTIIPFIKSKIKRRILFFVVFVSLIASLLMIGWQFIRPQGMNGPLSPLGVEFTLLPKSNVNTFLVEIKMPLGTALNKTAEVAQAVGDVLGKSKYVTNYQIFGGINAPMDFASLMRSYKLSNIPNIAQIRVNIIKEDRPHTNDVVIQINKELNRIRDHFKNAKIEVLETPAGPPTRAQILAQLYGPNYKKLKESARYIESYFKKVYGVVNVDSSVYQPVKEYRLVVNYSKAILSGISPYQISQTLYAYIHGVKIAWTYNVHQSEPVYIILRVPKANRANIEQILNIRMKNNEGKLIPLRSIVYVKKTYLAQPIYDRDQHKVVYVSADLLRSSPVYAVLYLNSVLDGKKLPNGVRFTTSNLGIFSSHPVNVVNYTIRWGGDMRLTLNVFRDLGIAFIAALIFIYFMLVAYYRSFMLPLIVMGPIPLTVIGVFPGHWIMHQPFTATSMIGVIALAGIVVRNSLLLIDFALDYREKGYPLSIAIIEAGAVRFRPILLTALAIIFGSAIMITDPIFGGLAISLIFGTFASTMLSLLLIPLLYFSWQKWAKKGK